MSTTTTSTAAPSSTPSDEALEGLLRAELHQLATTLGIPGATRLRKAELVEAIAAKRVVAQAAPVAVPGPAPVPVPVPDTDPDGTSISGVLEIRDGHAFLRTSGYLPGPDDLYVSMGQVRNLGLRTGDLITGTARSEPGNSGNGRKTGRSGRSNPSDRSERTDRSDRRTALGRVDLVNGRAPELMRNRPEFTKLTPLYPQEQLHLETDPGVLATRVIDLVAPIGKGQRGLIVAPPKTGKTMILQSIAAAVAKNHPEAHLMVVLVDERPEEVTDMQRSVQGEVLASTFDRPAREHIALAELAIERAKRLVELGHDVVVMLDSITRLARAYNTAAPTSGRILTGGLDAGALHLPKRFFGASRNIEDGGSLTIIATALVDTGSRMDDLIFEELKSTGNMELRLDRRLADRRVFPAVDPQASGTRREELLLGPARTTATWTLRRVLNALDTQAATELLIDRLKQSPNNADFLRKVAVSRPADAA
ncbi:transcription termination factor Rho [Streptacidiphilus fuscans]|uniref:Transcription termination factor Rho n=1 Tax=Streptacidiphilus fuscans TaxID=2789292 RepID=A0A931B0Y9_9ACTN|nr:transcription termination factor Rho [Streptacidiphilus fuscans]MBF9066672.1 transcription termination factor Rho [Streptacidiphilus fuscans]